MSHPLPDGVRQQAVHTLHTMMERGLRHPHTITTTCKQIATVVLAKLDNVDKILVRKLTNALVMYAWDHVSTPYTPDSDSSDSAEAKHKH